MEQRESIEQILDNLDNNIVYKTKSSLVLNIALTVLGIAAIVASLKITQVPNGIVTPLLIVLGVGALGAGVISIFFKKTHYISKEDKQRITFYELFLDIKERDKVIRILSEGNVQELKKLKPSVSDALKLRVATTPNGKMCYTQVVTYIPFEFVNANDARQHSEKDAQTILEVVKNIK